MKNEVCIANDTEPTYIIPFNTRNERIKVDFVVSDIICSDEK